TVPEGSLVADRNSEQILINQFDHNLWHEGSGMAFGPDGFLYLSVSDEGDAYDSYHNTQPSAAECFPVSCALTWTRTRLAAIPSVANRFPPTICRRAGR